MHLHEDEIRAIVKKHKVAKAVAKMALQLTFGQIGAPPSPVDPATEPLPLKKFGYPLPPDSKLNLDDPSLFPAYVAHCAELHAEWSQLRKAHVAEKAAYEAYVGWVDNEREYTKKFNSKLKEALDELAQDAPAPTAKERPKLKRLDHASQVGEQDSLPRKRAKKSDQVDGSRLVIPREHVCDKCRITGRLCVDPAKSDGTKASGQACLACRKYRLKCVPHISRVNSSDDDRSEAEGENIAHKGDVMSILSQQLSELHEQTEELRLAKSAELERFVSTGQGLQSAMLELANAIREHGAANLQAPGLIADRLAVPSST